MNKLLEKLIAVLLVITLASANFILLATYQVAYALSEDEIISQTVETEDANVEFNAYLEGGEHIKTANAETEQKIYLNIKVKNEGYLGNAEISFSDVNFKLGENIQNGSIQKVDVENNKITLNQINNGSDVTIEVPITILNTDKVTADNFSKETKTTFTGTYVDGKGKEKNISKEIINKISWETESNAIVTAEMTKYIPYTKDGIYGVMVQSKINSGIENSKLPIKETNLEVNVPTIKDTRPTKVTVISNQMMATRGEQTGINFGQENYNYNQENGIVTINTKNEADENGQISWKKNAQDEYIVTFIFEGEELYNEVNTNGIDSKINIKVQITTLDKDITTLEKTIEHEVKATEVLGTITDFNISATTEIAKGYIYSNYNASTKSETSYRVRYSSTVANLEVTDSIEFAQEYDKFVTEDEKTGFTTIENKNYAYNKTVKISQKVFNKILSEEGKIELLNAEGTVIGTINKDTEKDSNENYMLDISELNNNKLTIRTSKPISVGTIILEVEKAIKGEIDYSLSQMKSFTKLKTEVLGKSATTNSTVSQEILLKEIDSVAGIEINKKDFTTVIENENVEIRATLDTSSIYNALYRNPTLKIEIPSYIEKLNINSANILMDNGLTVKSVKPVVEDEAYSIYVELEGTQKEYTIDAEYKGTIIVLDTDMSVETLTPSNTSKIKMAFTNANTVSTNESGVAETEINFVAPTGVVTANAIADYANDAQEVMSISEEQANVEIETYGEKKVATITGTVINNYENKITNVTILGRFPVKENNGIDESENLEANFDTILNTAIAVSGGIETGKYTVYYSENADATMDLQNEENGWTTTPTTASKSYMIATNDYEMEAGKVIEFKYNVEIPENLSYNNNVYQMYKVYYNNVSDIGTIAEMKSSAVMRLSTGQGPVLETTVTPMADVIREGQIVKMKLAVKNTGSITATNVNVNIPLAENTSFIEYITGNGFYPETVTTKTINLGTLESGKTTESSYYLKIDDYTEEKLFPKQIVHQVKVTSDELQEGVTSEECKMNIEDGQIAIEMIGNSGEKDTLKNNQVLEYTINVENISGKTELNNTVVKIPLPEGISYRTAVVKDGWDAEEATTDGVSYDSSSKNVQVNLGTLKSNKTIILTLVVDKFNGDIAIKTSAQAEGTDVNYSNITEYKAEVIDLELSELTVTPKYVKEGETVTYNISITNKGTSPVYDIKVTDELPDGIDFVKATYTYGTTANNILNEKNGKVVVDISTLPGGQTTNISIVGKAGLLSDKNDKHVENKVSVVAKNFAKVESNSVENVIEYNQEIHDKSSGTSNQGGQQTNTPTKTTYKIAGTAWIDTDKDGRRDAEEEILANIPVILIYKSNNTIVKDSDTNEEKRTTTNNNGTYQFDNLDKGEYLVIFLYESSKYTLAPYRATDVDETLNSDAIDINVTLDGARRLAGITDVIKITDTNIRDIDIGLYSAEKFDLKLDKYISKITLTTPTIGTRTYQYENSKAAKIEVLDRNVGKSNIVIEYKIVITNEGAVSGYAKKIVDYLPEHTKFSTELNKDWYLSENGNVYNTSLANTKINPGESKEITLVLTAKITEASLGVLNNNAEIYESYNEQGLQDLDSIVANTEPTEDDMSKADLVLSLVTGKIMTYTALILGIVVLMAFGIYEIKRKVLKRTRRD